MTPAPPLQPWGEALVTQPPAPDDAKGEGDPTAPKGREVPHPRGPAPYPPWAYRVDPAEYEHRARALVARGWRIMRPADIDHEDPRETLTAFYDARRDPHGHGVGDLVPFAEVRWPDNWLPSVYVASPDWHRIPHADDAADFDWSTVRIITDDDGGRR